MKYSLLKNQNNLKRKILFRKDDPIFSELNQLLEESDRKSIILWALDYSQHLVDDYQLEAIAQETIEITRNWAQGIVKMPEAKKYILACHQKAKEVNQFSSYLYHAVGQGCSVVHTTKHALGLPIYYFSYLVKTEQSIKIIEEMTLIIESLKEYIRTDKSSMSWAKFIKN